MYNIFHSIKYAWRCHLHNVDESIKKEHFDPKIFFFSYREIILTSKYNRDGTRILTSLTGELYAQVLHYHPIMNDVAASRTLEKKKNIIKSPHSCRCTPWSPNFYSRYIDGLVQEKCNSSVLAIELRLSCTNPPISEIQKNWRIFF